MNRKPAQRNGHRCIAPLFMAPLVLVISPDWRLRVLLQAQLVQDGFDVQSFIRCEEAETQFPFGNVQPDLVAFNIEAELNPRAAFAALDRHVSAANVIVLTGTASLASTETRRLGFDHPLSRPCAVGDVIAAIRSRLKLKTKN